MSPDERRELLELLAIAEQLGRLLSRHYNPPFSVGAEMDRLRGWKERNAVDLA